MAKKIIPLYRKTAPFTITGKGVKTGKTQLLETETILAQAVGYKISGNRIKGLPVNATAYYKRTAPDGTLVFTINPDEAFKTASIEQAKRFAQTNGLQLAWFKKIEK
ncbi:hypothetical protein [Lactococcus allomyrinae]|uniref:Uncharacterized protein n=1 Tax=Lactococcus allomyrinae TaxID=2419773 RepID=A0A387BBL9_9LACT|nr:hypothetical protein [Lactococcus allomyrinae]AYG01163.1 hypothetical protein D7I46_08670 [Lactococcus allomyrinae]